MPIYIGTQKIDVSGMEKVYVGTQLVYQKIPVLISITLSGQTTSLDRGAAFSFGGTVTAHYSNGSTANVTASTTFSGYNMSTAGTYTVTASYTENGVTQTATYSLTVNKVWSTMWTGTWNSWQGSDFTVSAIKNLSGKCKLRITMTYNYDKSTLSQNWYQYNPNATKGTNKTTSGTFTNTYNEFTYTSSYNLAGITTSSDTSTIKLRISYKGSGKFGNQTAAVSQAYKIRITKIEQYY